MSSGALRESSFKSSFCRAEKIEGAGVLVSGARPPSPPPWCIIIMPPPIMRFMPGISSMETPRLMSVPAFEVGHVNEDGLSWRQSIAPEDRRGVGRRGSPDRDARRDQADSGNHSDCGGRARESGAGAIQ